MRKHFLFTVTIGLAAYLLLPLPGLSSSLQNRIDRKHNQIEHARSKEQVLTTDISRYSARIQTLHGDITDLQTRQDAAQRELDAKMAELNEIRDKLQISQDHLTRLRARLAHDRKLLSDQLVALYKDDQPDMVTVVLESDGFTDLLDRSEYIDRITAQNNDIVTRVKETEHEVAIETKRLQGLEAEAQDAAEVIQQKRDEIAGAKATLVSRQTDLQQARGARQNVLDRIQSHRHEFEGELSDLEAKQSEIQARLQAANAGISAPAGPIKQGSGNFIWPVNGPVVSGFGMRWGRLHAGVDIAVPEGTAIRAAAAGTVSLMQPEASSGGYGNYTCISHGGGISTCYAHQSAFGTSMGAHVSQGQVIGSSGCTGHCFGPHVHFEVRVNGAPVDPMGYL
jgi:murein DD-endopeptidase MepM/ murein hydrolase activator NlpD